MSSLRDIPIINLEQGTNVNADGIIDYNITGFVMSLVLWQVAVSAVAVGVDKLHTKGSYIPPCMGEVTDQLLG